MITKTRIFPIILLFILNGAIEAKNAPPLEEEQRSILTSIYEHVDERLFNENLFNQALNSQHINIQETALRGLGRVGGDTIKPFVKPFLYNNNAVLRRAAVFALGISGESNVNYLLWPLLEKETEETVKQELY